MKLIQVTNWVWRGSQPWSDADWYLVEKAGAQTVVKLNELKTGAQDEGWTKRGLGLGTYPIPDEEAQSELGDETRWRLSHAIDLVCQFQNEISPVFVHCTEGVDRTGIVIAAFRVLVQKWTPKAAYDEWVAMGSHHYAGLEKEWARRFPTP